MKNIKVNYTNFNEKRTSTTIKASLANIYYRESNYAEWKKTILDRPKHEKEVKRVIQEFVNTQHKEEYEETSTWEDQQMIEDAILEDIVFYVRKNTKEAWVK